MTVKQTEPLQEKTHSVHQLLKNIKTPQNLTNSEWMTSCLITQMLAANPTLHPLTALQKLVLGSLKELRITNPEHADLLRERFWQQMTVDELVFGIHKGKWSKRNFFNIQKKAIHQLTEILMQKEKRCLHRIQLSQILARVPHKPYDKLVGRTDILQQLITILQPTHHQKVIGIDGMGGIGKTALAMEVAEQCAQANIFDSTIWVSAAQNRRNLSIEVGLSFDDVLNAMGDQLGKPNIASITIPEKKKLISTLLLEQRILIILDNLETAAEPQSEIIRQLYPLLGNSKLLCTSRYRFDDFEVPMFNVNLIGLSLDDAVTFLRQEGKEKGITRIKEAPIDALIEISIATGGSPLAMKLVSGQLIRLPLHTVLKTLKHIPALTINSKDDEYLRFYKHIFLTSVNMLSSDGETVLIATSHFPPGEGKGGTFEMIKAMVRPLGIQENALVRAINELWQLSLLEIDRASTVQTVRYYLHVLTQYMVLADLLHLLR